MGSERWKRVRGVLEEALERPLEERSFFLDRACGADAKLRNEVESLLARASDAEVLFENPPVSGIEMRDDEPERSLVGRSLIHYRILAEIGRGGMGVVYRARDDRLDRDVAVKVLPSEVSRDAVRLERFEREARATGRLNHPNILVVHDVGVHEGTSYLVTELVQGKTLRQRLAGERPSRTRALAWAVQIASGLAAAHGERIVHRDLKPENIVVTPDDRIKILDFGLAQVVSANPGGLDSEALTQSAISEKGIVIGTVSYLSPEQARGEAVDPRSDIFALGIVLHELLTGRHPFLRATSIETMGAILRDEPTLEDPDLPSSLARIVLRCLEKDPALRFQSALDLAFALEGPPGHAAPEKRTSRAPWLVAAASLVGAAALGILVLSRNPPPALLTRELALLAPEGTTFDWERYGGSVPVLSPDGRRIAFLAVGEDGSDALWIRSFDEAVARKLSGSETATYPFWSPDGASIAFHTADGSVYRTGLSSGDRPVPVVGASFEEIRGGAWNGDGVVLIGQERAGIVRIPATGGEPIEVTALDPDRRDASHRFPQFLPGGTRFLFFNLAGDEASTGICVGSLDSTETTFLLANGSGGQYADPGHLLFVRDGVLLARPFDPDSLELGGDSVALAQDVDATLQRHGAFSVSSNGVLVYGTDTRGADIAWLDRSGRTSDTMRIPRLFNVPTLSPDGRQLVYVAQSPRGDLDLWLIDRDRKIPTRFTSHTATDVEPLWSPDGRTIVFSSNRRGTFDLYRKRSDGSGDTEIVPQSVESAPVVNRTPEGPYLAYGTTSGDVWALPMGENGGAPIELVATPFIEARPRLSPDGNWLAYASDESGVLEVYVRSFSGEGRKWTISSGGGTAPHWRSDGRELFFVDPKFRLVVVDVSLEAGAFHAGWPQVLFETPIGWNFRAADFDVTPDGQEFLFAVGAPVETPPRVILGWQALLER